VEKLVPSPRRPSCSRQQGVQAHECITFADLLLRELSNAGAECGRTLTFGCVQRLSNGYARDGLHRHSQDVIKLSMPDRYLPDSGEKVEIFRQI
jgi:hypothetical protein